MIRRPNHEASDHATDPVGRGTPGFQGEGTGGLDTWLVRSLG